jgi:hypothetical protein
MTAVERTVRIASRSDAESTARPPRELDVELVEPAPACTRQAELIAGPDGPVGHDNEREL